MHVCDSDENKSKEVLADETLSQVCYTNESKSESVIVNESYTEESKLESVQKSINKNEEKDEIDETLHKEPLLTNNLVINDPRYFNLF